MATRMRDAMQQRMPELRFEPTDKTVRVEHHGRPVALTPAAVLVWEPRRVVPSYAFPVEQVTAALVPSDGSAPPPADDGRVLHPGIPFSVHSTPGRMVDVAVGDLVVERGGFLPDDPGLDGFVVLDFDAFDGWYEEAEQIFSHPRDPFHRVDARPTDKHVRVELDGRTVAESSRAMLVFETGLAPCYYLPPEDVTAPCTPTDTHTGCAYKGRASYWSVGDHADVAWSYEDPLPDAVRIRGMLSFWGDAQVLVDDAAR